MEYEPNSSKNAVKRRKKNKDNFQRNCTARRFHTKKLAKNQNTSNLQKKKKVTERMQATTGEYVVFQYCTSYSLQYFMLDLPPDCTKYNLPIRRGFDPTIDVMITSWCTGCWSNVVVSGVYRCTSARLTSRKHLTVLNTLLYGAPFSSMVLNQLTWDYCKDFTANKRAQFWLTKKATHFQSNGERSKEIHYPPYYSTQCCNTHWRMIWNSGRKTKRHQVERQSRGPPDEPEICGWRTALLHVVRKTTWNALRVHVRGSGNWRSQKQVESSVGSVPQISTRIDIERLPPLPQTSPFQHGSNTDDDLRQWNVVINTKARKRWLRLRNGRCFAWMYKRKENLNRKIFANKKRRGHWKSGRKRQWRYDRQRKRGRHRAKLKERSRQWCIFWGGGRRRNRCHWKRRRMDRIHQKKHQRGRRTYGKTKNTLLDWNTQKIEVADGTKNRFPTWKKIDQKSFLTGILHWT